MYPGPGRDATKSFDPVEKGDGISLVFKAVAG
jgi:hypothetical protein